ncbi:MAG: tandem-95 repeat protein, partial [Frankiales bacterium]|nr:tandem-95 repeat protein [Frankiales bacterium]
MRLHRIHRPSSTSVTVLRGLPRLATSPFDSGHPVFATRFRRLLAGSLATLLGAVVLLPFTSSTAWATPTVSLISGEIEQLTLNTPGDVWSGGWIRVGAQAVVLPRNLLMDLPANRLSLEQLFAAAPSSCADRGESGLAKSDLCNITGTGGFATIQANRTNAGDVVAGDVFIEKGREIVSGAVSYVNVDDGYFRVNGTSGSDAGGTMVRLNDPTGRHTVQRGAGCPAASSTNCSPDPRFALDAENYTAAFSTGYPMCIPSTVPRPFTDSLDVNRNGDATEQLTAQSSPDGTGDMLCPDTNRNPFNEAVDSRLLAPLLVGDHVTARGNLESVAGVRFLSAFGTKIGTALSTTNGPDQPDYTVIDSMFIDAPGFQRVRIRDQFLGASTEADSDVVLWSVHRDPVDNKAHDFPLGSVLGCETVAGPLTCRRVLGPNTFRIRHDTLFAANTAKNAKLSACSQLRADFRFQNRNICPDGGTTAEEFGILSPLPHEVQARTGRKMADLARPGGGVLKTIDINARSATNGQFLYPMGIGLGGIEAPNFAEIDINQLGTPTSFDGIPWNLDRRLSPNGCVGPCESTPQPLDPFPFSGFDPRVQGGVPEVHYNDPNYTASQLNRLPNRVLSYVDPALNNFNGDATLLSWPPVDPAAVGAPPPPPVPGAMHALITGLSPATGPENTLVTLDGIGLAGASAVSFGGVPAATFNAVSDTQLTVQVPAGAVTGPVAVTTPGGVLTSAARFTVLPPPTVTGITPSSGLPGTAVTVTGAGFSTATVVTVSGSATAFTVLSDTAIRTTVPIDAVTGPIVVTNPAGTATSSGTFTVTPPPPAPRVTGFAPSNGSPGTAVTIIGTGLQTAQAVYFGGVPALSFTAAPTSVTAIVPVGALTGPVSVATAGGGDASLAFFQVTAAGPVPAAPLISAVTPTNGPAGAQVLITGTNFVGVTTVTFAGKLAIFQQLPAGLLAVVPNGASTGAVVVTTTLGGSGIAPAEFTVTPAPPPDINPAITAFSPASGVPGTTVKLSGLNLGGTMGVSVNGTPARSFTVLSPTEISFVVDTGSSSGAILVDAPAGIALSNTDFSVIAPVPSIGSFTPASGATGTKVVLAGSNFSQVSAVTVGGVKAASFVVNSLGRLTLVVSSGTRSGRIQLRTAGGLATSAASFSFMPAPKIGSFSPARGKTGTKVVIAGNNFSQVSAVTVGGVKAASFVVNSLGR